MTEKQIEDIVVAMSDLLVGNGATLGEATQILTATTIHLIEATADKSAHNILKMEIANAFMKSTTMTPMGQILYTPLELDKLPDNEKSF